jgi:hypothetical protein
MVFPAIQGCKAQPFSRLVTGNRVAAVDVRVEAFAVAAAGEPAQDHGRYRSAKQKVCTQPAEPTMAEISDVYVGQGKFWKVTTRRGLPTLPHRVVAVSPSGYAPGST